VRTIRVWLVVSMSACGHPGAPEQPRADTQAGAIPRGRITVAELAPPGTEHHEVLRIAQAFHPQEDYEVAIDAWTHAGELVGVRVGWVDGAGTRSVFGRGVRRHLQVSTAAVDARTWRVELAHGDAIHELTIRLGDDRSVSAQVEVLTPELQVVSGCRAVAGRLVARTFLGLPTGLQAIEVRCVAGDGREHTGRLVAR
jgi:hypothetical protein